MRDARLHFGVSRRCVWLWVRDLEAIGAVKRTRQGRRGTLVTLFGEQVFTLKRKPDGSLVRCRVCGVAVKAQAVGGTGDLCAEHKQTAGRSDAPWIEAAHKLYRKGMRNPNAIHARLAREGYVAPVADYLLEGREKCMPGLISWGIKWGYLDAETWGRIHRERLAGEDAGDA